MTNICTICRHDLSGFPVSTLECGHPFHSECLLNHFRSPRDWAYSVEGYGTCPLCRAGPVGFKRSVSYSTGLGRVRIIKNLAKIGNVHPKIQRSIDRFDSAKKAEKEAKKAFIHFKKTNAIIYKEWEILRKKRWQARSKLWRATEELASWDPLSMLDCPYAFIN